MTLRKDGAFVLAGIVSFGMPCNEYDYISQIASFEDFEPNDGAEGSHGHAKFFGVYTAVANFVDWIEQNSDYTDCMTSKHC